MYSHVINALGGFQSATINLSATQVTMGEWLEKGLGRHIEVFNPAMSIAWEGFVNQVDVVYGNLTVTVGPLMQVVNRLNAMYTTVDVSVIPPTEGLEAETGWLDNAASQARYGILVSTISLGETNPADAAAVAATYLANQAQAATTQVFTSTATQPSVNISCLGYYHWLSYLYNQEVVVGTINTDAKIIDILTGTDAATGNPYNLNSLWLPFGTSHIATPAAPAAVPAYEYENKTAWNLIQDTVARGDTNQARWLFGVYAGRQAWYQQQPTTVEYSGKLEDLGLRIFGPGEVDPWDVRPGKWIRWTDFDPGYYPSTLQEDPRVQFIENVTYTMPNQLSLNGEVQGTLQETMASFGLGGI